MELPLELVTSARKEEMAHMKGKIFKVVKKSEAWAKTGKPPKSTKWVDTDKSHGEGEMLVRSRWVARDFKTRGERDREDLFCATPPLELLRFLASRAATRAKSGRKRKMLFIDVKKAHLIPKCQEDIYMWSCLQKHRVVMTNVANHFIGFMGAAELVRRGRTTTRTYWWRPDLLVELQVLSFLSSSTRALVCSAWRRLHLCWV